MPNRKQGCGPHDSEKKWERYNCGVVRNSGTGYVGVKPSCSGFGVAGGVRIVRNKSTKSCVKIQKLSY